jgi:peptide/nickel transport system substrate-binding protein
MKINRFKFRNLIIPILAVMACVPGLTQANDNTLKVALVAEPRLLEPSIDTIKPSLVIGMTMLEPLTMNTAEGGYVPWLAESWTAVDQNRWRLTLKKDVQFHNGEQFNADTVIYSLGVFQNTQGGARGWSSYITGVEKVSEFEVDLITESPTTTLPATLAFLFMFPPEYHGEVG